MAMKIRTRHPYRSPRRFTGLVALLLAALFSAAAAAQAPEQPAVKNLIYMIGDGMSFAQLESARVVKGAPLVMDTLPVQNRVQTASASDAVTDSAAGGTAHATGFRTNNRMVALAPDGSELLSVLRLAQMAGKATGVVVTDYVYGATPGAFLANVQDRSEYSAILEHALFRTQPDVLLGGGLTVFGQIGGPTRLSETPYQLVRNRDELLAWQPEPGAKLLGLFAADTLSYEVDKPASEPRLVEMAAKALEILSQHEEGFFLMIEGSRIDHAGHANDLRRSVYEVLAFDETLGLVLEFAASRGDTLIVVSADHETGGLTPGKGTPAAAVIREGAAAIAARIRSAVVADPNSDIAELFAREAGITDLTSVAHQGSLNDLLVAVLNDHSYYYTTTGHTATPVPLLAYGPGAERFATAQHTSEAGRLAIELFGVAQGGDR